MTKEDLAHLRISRSALALHITDVIDRLIEKEVVGDVFADTVTEVYLHILCLLYQSPSPRDRG